MKKLVVFTIVFVLIATCSQSGLFAKSKIKINHKRITITIGQNKKLKIKNKPKKAKVKWYSKNTKVAKVTKKGLVKAKRPGKTTIIAKVKKKKFKCTVIVKNKKSVMPTKKVVPVQPTTEDSERRMVRELSQRMNVVSHRGYNSIAPENSLAAFRLAKEKGYSIVETDVKFTLDGVPIMCHDATINRVARNLDGAEISEPVRITQITYEQALQYDFGIYKSPKYRGTKILKFEDFLQLCKEINLEVYLHLFMGTEDQVRYLYDLVDSYGLKNNVTWYSFTPQFVTYMRDIDHTVRLGVATDKGITQGLIDTMLDLHKYGNPVFIDSATYSKEEIKLCKDAGIPLEVYFFNSFTEINNLDCYISGVTVDYIE